jgi:hypothetical protein
VPGLQIRVANRTACDTSNHHTASGSSVNPIYHPARERSREGNVGNRCETATLNGPIGTTPRTRTPAPRLIRPPSPGFQRPPSVHEQDRHTRRQRRATTLERTRTPPAPSRATIPSRTHNRVNPKHAASGLRAPHTPENIPAPFYGAFEYNRHSLVTRRVSVTA